MMGGLWWEYRTVGRKSCVGTQHKATGLNGCGNTELRVCAVVETQRRGKRAVREHNIELCSYIALGT